MFQWHGSHVRPRARWRTSRTARCPIRSSANKRPLCVYPIARRSPASPPCVASMGRPTRPGVLAVRSVAL
eukprot:2386620-Pyramimonas_sp.AAC.1